MDRATSIDSSYGLIKALNKEGHGIVQLPKETKSFEERKYHRLNALYVYEALRRAKQELYGIVGRYAHAGVLGDECDRAMEWLEKEFGTMYQIHNPGMDFSFVCQASFLGNGVEGWFSEQARKYREEHPDWKVDLLLITEDHPSFVVGASNE